MLRVIWAYVLYTWGGLHRYFGNQNNVAHEFRRAVHYFSRAYAVNPHMVQARLARAVLLWRELDQPEEALAELSAILEEDPEMGEALFNRASIWQQQGQYKQALDDLNSYLDLQQPDAYRDLALRMQPLLADLVEDQGS